MKRKAYRITRLLVLMGLGLALLVGLALGTPHHVKAAASPNGKTFMVYYRAWRDKTMKGVNTDIPDANTQTMLDLPRGIDIVNVFSYVPGGQEEAAAPYFEALKTTYAPALHQRGVKLVRALGYMGMVSDFQKYYAALDGSSQFNDDEAMAAVDAWAKQEIETLSGQYGLDGLDIDMEQYPTAATTGLTDILINALGKYIGPRANNGTLFIYDSNGSYMAPFQNVVKNFSYVGYQQYGSTTTRTEAAAADYKAVGFDTRHFLAGLTFPEEGDNNRWYDTDPSDFLGSHTHQEADFIAKSDLGGMFMYAVDRDGRTYSETDLNHVTPTTYRWTKTAIAETKGYTLAQVQQAGLQHVQRVAADLKWDDATVAKTTAAINDAQTIFDVYSAFMSDDYQASLDPRFDAVLELENPLADKTALTAAITKAEAVLPKVKDQAALTAAIAAGKTVVADAWATQAATDSATQALTTAIKAAEAALAAQAKADYAAGKAAGKADGLAGKASQAKQLTNRPAQYQAGYAVGYREGAKAHAIAEKAATKAQKEAERRAKQAAKDAKQATKQEAKDAKHAAKAATHATKSSQQPASQAAGKQAANRNLPQTGDAANFGLVGLGLALLLFGGLVWRKA
ncbi:EndoS/ChiA family endoglycosidase [Lacticaseibacillus suihuaensis]